MNLALMFKVKVDIYGCCLLDWLRHDVQWYEKLLMSEKCSSVSFVWSLVENANLICYPCYTDVYVNFLSIVFSLSPNFYVSQFSMFFSFDICPRSEFQSLTQDPSRQSFILTYDSLFSSNYSALLRHHTQPVAVLSTQRLVFSSLQGLSFTQNTSCFSKHLVSFLFCSNNLFRLPSLQGFHHHWLLSTCISCLTQPVSFLFCSHNTACVWFPSLQAL